MNRIALAPNMAAMAASARVCVSAVTGAWHATAAADAHATKYAKSSKRTAQEAFRLST